MTSGSPVVRLHVVYHNSSRKCFSMGQHLCCRSSERKASITKTKEFRNIADNEPKSDLKHFEVNAMGLYEKDMFRLKNSWRGVDRNMEEAGLEMFVRLFSSRKDLKAMFNLDPEATVDELRSNEALEDHATVVMTTLDDAITHIDDYDYVHTLLFKQGGSHVKIEGFHKSNFKLIEEPFLDAVKITLGDRYTENMESIYKVAIRFIVTTMAEGMQEAMDKKAAQS